MKNFNEDGMKKAEIGLKVLTKDVTLNCGFDCITQKYSADAVYGVCVCNSITASTIKFLLVCVSLVRVWKLLLVMPQLHTLTISK